MKIIFDKLNQYINLYSISTTIILLSGLILFLFPEGALYIIAYLIGGLFFLIGTSLIISKVLFLGFLNTSFLGILFLIPAFMIFFNPTGLLIFIPRIIGFFIIISSLIRLSHLLNDDRKRKSYRVSYAITILEIICGLIIFINPEFTLFGLTSILGFILIIYAIFDYVNIYLLKRKFIFNKKDISKPKVKDAKYRDISK